MKMGAYLSGSVDHEMHVQGKARHLANGRDHWRSDGQVWHEVAVHDVQVQHGGAALLDLGDLFAQAGEIRGQN